jgi:hypothetical protein
MPRQRSRKLSASRQSEQTSTPEKSAPEPDHEDFSDSENESPPISEKDEDEDKLERLVLGDGGAFKAQLSMQMDQDSEDDSGMAEDDLEAEVGLENVDDADVSTPLPMEAIETNTCEAVLPRCWTLYTRSYSSNSTKWTER